MKRAFTIIEMLFSCVIVMVLIGGILIMASAGNKGWSTEVGLLDLHQQARQAMHGMVREIRQGDAMFFGSTSGEIIEFRIPRDLSTDPVSYYQPISYYLSNEQIIREHPAGTTNVLANNIKSLNFCFWDGVDCCDPSTESCSGLNSLEISLEAEKEIRSRAVSFSIREEVKLRNE